MALSNYPDCRKWLKRYEDSGLASGGFRASMLEWADLPSWTSGVGFPIFTCSRRIGGFRSGAPRSGERGRGPLFGTRGARTHHQLREGSQREQTTRLSANRPALDQPVRFQVNLNSVETISMPRINSLNHISRCVERKLFRSATNGNKFRSPFPRITPLVLALLLTALAGTSLRADEATIRAVLGTYVEALNKKDLTTVAALWAENATHTDRETGERTEGRDAIQADIAAAFKQQPNARLAGRIERVRFIKPDVARVEGQSTVVSSDEEPIISAYSAILVSKDGTWLIDSIEEMPLARPATSYDALRELEWLVGRWVDDSGEARVDTTVRWTADRAFLLRSFALQTADSPAQQGTQVIGWDPRSQEIRSWTFNSDGSFGDATWSKNGEDWLIKSSQTLSDGRASSGTFVLSRVDDNTITLQLIGHEVEGEPQPAGQAVTVVRVADDNQPATSPANKQ